jgi:dTDP-4-amino-4,6-dideoxygalactose transaminase
MEAAAGRPGRLTEALTRRIDPVRLRERRRRNYQLLRDELAELCPEPYRELPTGTCPLYFPVQTEDRDRAIAGLLDRGVRALEIWPVPHPLLDRERFAELEPARRSLLALPTHQSLGPWQMDRVLEAARAVLGIRCGG